MDAVSTDDDVMARRRLIQRLSEVGQRLGYGLFAASIICFFVALFTGFSSLWVVVITTCMIVGSVFLAPAIVAGYAVKAADREDREAARG